MSNLFEEVLADAKGVEEKLLGPDYDYVNKIKTPDDIGLSDNGSIDTLVKDIEGLLEYTEVLVTGENGTKGVSGPLGSRFFLETGQTCIDVATGNEVKRSIYVDNVPNGSLPFITSAYGVRFTTFEGLIPGAMSNISAINPFAMMQSFLSGGVPDCKAVTMPVVGNDGPLGNQTGYVTVVDINNNLDNNGLQAYQGFQSGGFKKRYKHYKNKTEKSPSLPDDHVIQIFFFGLSIIGVYILYKIMLKHK